MLPPKGGSEKEDLELKSDVWSICYLDPPRGDTDYPLDPRLWQALSNMLYYMIVVLSL